MLMPAFLEDASFNQSPTFGDVDLFGVDKPLRDAAAGRKRFTITHSEIFPGTYASTTECTDWLLGQLGLRRRAVLAWGPMGLQQLSDARAGRFHLMGFAGNTAPDHVDQLHALPALVKGLK